MLIHVYRSSHGLKHQQSRISRGVGAPTVQPDVDEVVRAADAESAHVVHGGHPAVVVVAAVARVGAGGGVGGEGGVVGGLVVMVRVWVVRVTAGAVGHRG
jgi:hypothetical protein